MLPRFVAALPLKRKSPAPKAFGAGFWRRPTDSIAPAHFGLSALTSMSRLPSSLHSLLEQACQKTKCPMGLTNRAFSSGDVLLSHGLSPYYHRGCSVSLPCSEWERVGPLRYSHQKPAPIFGASFWCVIRDWLHRYNGCRLSSALTF